MSERLCECGVEISAGSSLEVCGRCYQRAYQREYRRRHYHEVIKRDPYLLEIHRTQCRKAMARYFADPDKREAYNAKRRKADGEVSA
jgi:hypothetical protein